MTFESFEYEALGLSSWKTTPSLVGVLNVTPDSFSDGGQFYSEQDAVRGLAQLHEEGAAIIDVGAEATGPGSRPLSEEEELSRLAPIFARLSETKAIVSIDTYKAAVAEVALARGCRVINDVSALRAEPRLAEVVARHNAYLVLMYAKDAPLPHVRSDSCEYDDVTGFVGEFLCKRIEHAVSEGVSPTRIVIDPGMGRFVSNDARYSFQLVRELHRLRSMGLTQPIMVGLSRKGFLGGNLANRDPLSQLAAVAAWQNGAQFIRTHNIRMAREFFALWTAVSSTPAGR